MNTVASRPLLAIALAALAVSALLILSGRVTSLALAVGAIAAVVTVLEWKGRPALVRLERKPARPRLTARDEYVARVFALPAEEAERRARPLLESLYVLEESPPAGADRIQELAPSLHTLFARYSRMTARFGDAALIREQIAPFPWPPTEVLGFGRSPEGGETYLRIGTDLDGNPVLTKPGEETVYVVRGPRAEPARRWLASYPTLYHWLLVEHPDHEG